jgi:hypothetical protein
MRTHAHTYTRSRTNARAHTHTRTHTRTRARTHTPTSDAPLFGRSFLRLGRPRPRVGDLESDLIVVNSMAKTKQHFQSFIAAAAAAAARENAECPITNQ